MFDNALVISTCVVRTEEFDPKRRRTLRAASRCSSNVFKVSATQPTVAHAAPHVASPTDESRCFTSIHGSQDSTSW
jgi:hypothetical protein